MVVLGTGGGGAAPRGSRSGWPRSAWRSWSGTPLVPELRWRRWRWEVREHEIDLQRGILVVRRTLIPMARVQHVETERGVIGQALGLSTVEIHTAAGSHEIPLLRDGDAGGSARGSRSSRAPTGASGADQRRRGGAAARRWVAACTRPRSRSTRPTRCARARSRCSCSSGVGVRRRLRRRGGAARAMFAAIGTAVAALAGGFRWATTSYSLAGGRRAAAHGRAVGQGGRDPVRARAGGRRPSRARSSACSASTASTSRRAEAARAARSCSARSTRPRSSASALLRRRAGAAGRTRGAPERRLTGRRLALAAATSGQLGVLVPVAAGVAQMSQQVFDDPIEGERTIAGALPDGALGWMLLATGVLVLAWLLAALGTVVGFGGFAVRRERDELRIRRGLLQRRQATLRVNRVRAVRVGREPAAPGARPGGAARRGDRPRQGAGRRPDAVPAAAPRGGRAVPARAAAGDGRPLDGLAAATAARAAPLRAAAARGHRALAGPPRSRSGARGRCWPRRSAPSTARSPTAPPAGAWRAAGSRSARAGSRARPCSPRPPAASRTTSPRRRSSAAPGWPTSRSRSARAPSPRSATSTPTTPGVCGRRSGQDREQLPMCGGGPARSFAPCPTPSSTPTPS